MRVMPAGVWRPTGRLIAGNRLFAAALVPALLLRVDAELGYRWQSWFNDSFSYVNAAVTLTPDTARPSGYPLFLWLLSPFHSYLPVTALQHLMGLLVAVMIYALAKRRFGAPSWVAVLATLPVLYDGFEIQLEHLIMTDTLFLFLTMAALTVVLWSDRPSWPAWLAAGLLLGLAAIVRSNGLSLMPVFGVYLLVRYWPRWRDGRGWARLVAGAVALVVACAGPVLGYEGWYKSAHGEFAMTESTGVFLYSRVMTFADCSRMSLPADLLSLCTTTPPDQRPIAQDYIWTQVSPLYRFPSPIFNPTTDKLAEEFAIKAIEAQPLDYARTVWDDTARSFDWNRSVFPDAQTYDDYLFGYQSVPVPSSPYRGYSSVEAYYARGNPDTVVVNPFARIIRLWQRYVWLPGTVYGMILLVGLFGIVARWRRAGRDALLPWLCSVVLIVGPAATAEFDYRYVTTAVPFACLAAAMAFARRPAGAPGVRPDLPAASAAGAGINGAGLTGDGLTSTGVLPGTGGEPGGAPGLPRRVPGRGLGGGLAEAGDDQRDLPTDAI